MANVYAYVTTAPQDASYANLGQAVGFTGLKSTLEGDGLTLLAPKNDLLGKEKIPMVYRWNAALTKELLTNHVAANTAPLTSSSADLEVVSTQKLDISENSDNKLTVDDIVATLAKDETGKFLVYDIDGVLVPTTQTGTSALDTNLLQGTAGRLGSFFATYATGDFYKALEDLNTGSTMLFSEDLGYTVFLPDSEAWESLTTAVEKKVGTKEYLTDGGLVTALKAHIVAGAAGVTNKKYKGLDGKDIEVDIPTVNIAGEDAKIANTVAANYKNGQVHNIDKVLQFPRSTTVEIAVATAATSTLVDLVTEYKLVDTLNGLTRSTVFAPTNEALNALVTYATWNTIDMTAKVMTSILSHHVVDSRLYAADLPVSGDVTDGLDGEKITREEIDVAIVDVIGTNGNVHVINKPLVPPTLASLIPGVSTVVDIAKDTTTTSTLYDFLANFPDVVKTLQKVAPGTSFTVFAPTNEAFAKLSDADVKYLTDNDNEKLAEVLLYHVVPSAALAGSLEASNSFPTVLGEDEKLVVKKDGEVVTVGSGVAKVIGADVKAINGVVHVIDEVLVPETVVLPSSVVPSAASSMTVSAAVSFLMSVCVAAF